MVDGTSFVFSALRMFPAILLTPVSFVEVRIPEIRKVAKIDTARAERAIDA